jgi:hypothetical protein
MRTRSVQRSRPPAYVACCAGEEYRDYTPARLLGAMLLGLYSVWGAPPGHLSLAYP